MHLFRIIFGFVFIGALLSKCIVINKDLESPKDVLQSKKVSEKEMLVGMFGMHDPKDYEYLNSLGFNTIVSSVNSERLEAAGDLGMNFISTCGIQYTSKDSVGNFDQAIFEFDSHPSLHSWYLVDEPAFNNIDPLLIHQAMNQLKSIGVSKPLSITSWRTDKLDFYQEFADHIMVDRYPIPWRGVGDLGHHVRMGKLAAGPGRPVYAIVQAFSWEAFPDVITQDFVPRSPSFAELNAMVFDAIAQGAEGIIFFSYKSGNWFLPEHPALWASTQVVVEKIKKYQEILMGQRPWVGFRQKYGDFSKRFNEFGMSSVTARFFEVQPGRPSGKFKPGLYLLAVNTTNFPQTYSIRLDAWAESETTCPASVLRLNDSQEVPVKEGWLTDDFKPLHVRVYGPFATR